MPRSVQIVYIGLVVFQLVFAVFLVTPSFILDMRARYSPDQQTAKLDLPRAARLRVNSEDARNYEKVIELVKSHAAGEYIYAGPDCPEVYFLSGKKNPTRDLFDFLNSDADHDAHILQVIGEHDVHVVVISHDRTFSKGLSEKSLTILARDFPKAEKAGRLEVRWRE